ncbi:I78 family peptidase inhibitor [Halomonas binhaiensis]|uniref:Peptidase inhibitor I78 family protein n=1 Tax=Halomonas binhaiensis TaxID=2562282 RepID=A0A5C1NAJ6_9GAMM|nr:I78 family peptidase inhibitor [Halomonas binhaiensis]QEM80396.1 hypothetical protein E4T21_01610 [Halomonas binhaiensis]
MKRFFPGLVMLAAVSMAGCQSSAQTAPSEPAPMPPKMGAQAPCDADAIQQHVGSQYQSSLDEQLLGESGAKTLRVLRPGDAATMDFRQDRLNVKLDDSDVIESLDCG